MAWRFVVLFLLVASASPLAETHMPQPVKGAVTKGSHKADRKRLTKEERFALIQRGQVWTTVDVPGMDLRAGPQGKGAFAPNQMVVCDYARDVKITGSSRKFNCTLADGDVVKVRYGTTNAEVEGSVLSSRLLWALGFGADRNYPVRVTCRGCSADPFAKRDTAAGERVFDPAVIERKPPGHGIATSDEEAGWSWTELSYVDAARGGATRAQRDALTLLAVFIQHTDSKAEQQRIWCLPGGADDDSTCGKPFLMIHDLGLTFGHADFSNATAHTGVNFADWARTPVWRDAARCIAHMSRSYTGTLGNPKIGEPGRAFLADLLVQLTDTQLHDLFDVARVEMRRLKQDGSDTASAASVDQWVAAFKRKRDEIVTNRCPA